MDDLFRAEMNRQAHSCKLSSRGHFSLDGTLLDACSSIKSFHPKRAAACPPVDDEGEPSGDGDSRGGHLSNATLQPTKDPDAWLYCTDALQLVRV